MTDSSDPCFRFVTKSENKKESESPAEAVQSAAIALPVPPDGGHGWIQVLVAHYSFGIFEQYYHQELGFSLSSTSWIGSIHLFFLFALSTISGRLFDAGYFRHLLIIGSFLQLLGLFMASISTEYWHLFLAQGVCSGIGAGLAYCPVMACVSTYFTKKRAFAIAVVTSGSATGGIIFPIIAQQVICGSFLILWSVFIGPSYINHYAASVVGIRVKNLSSVFVFVSLFGFVCGGIQTVGMAGLPTLTIDHSKMGPANCRFGELVQWLWVQDLS
ncbi:hypothetical protein FPSE_08870 [Fusarium pseudograminearum CS3096]|uniref:Major facilitator superfamily (MFS) profile domain-containing protein n=1 Tax=Fusarium pseudograminearum (strain CS3096) TaxID=1028729 RepID=K3UGL4_FUSPC|nr:hypothetical protein FPSE_08870 [Fusarium pseudograminearum CS3096]EKJ70956.1 hypothetical protein FPSE_08870 [Fusarium pseudograminearum CS3096]